MLSSFNGMIRILLIPLGILLAAQFALPSLRGLSPAFQPLLPVLPYGAALLAMTLALLFNQGRVFFIALLLVLGYWALIGVQATAVSDPFYAASLLTAASILLPLNIAVFSLLQERGVLNGHGLFRAGLIGIQLALVGWVIASRRTDLLYLVSSEFLPFSWNGVHLPDSALLGLMAAGALQVWLLSRQQSVLSGGLLLVLAAVAIACNRVGTYGVPEAFIGAAGLILAVSLVLHSHQIAYRDELTGLPARRALNERLAGLGRQYTIAMLDVDHFKKFNDTYGHDVGDQVLKMVASRIRRVRGGGKAFRYGGEEFTILFPGKDMEYAEPYLEEVRQAVADYALALRGEDRPDDRKTGRGKRGQGRGARTVSVTISIGMAERDRELRDPEAVIKAADQALYRAKKAGRNRLCG